MLTLVAATLFGLVSRDGSTGRQIAPNVEQRLTTLEQTLRQRTTTSGGDVAAKLAQTDTRLKGLEDQSRAVTALSDTQSKLAATIKSLESRSASPEVVNRLAKLETALAALSAGDKSGTPAAALADKLTELERLVGDATEANKSGAARADRDLAAVKTEASRFGQRLDALKGDIDERLKGTAKAADLTAVAAKLAAFEQDLKGFLKGEGERTSNAARVLLTLEIANLKRAMDRGEQLRCRARRGAKGCRHDARSRTARALQPRRRADAARSRQGFPPRRQCGHRRRSRARRRHGARSPDVRRPLDRARAQGRARSPPMPAPKPSSAAWRPRSRTGSFARCWTRARSCRRRPRWPPKTGSRKSKRGMRWTDRSPILKQRSNHRWVRIRRRRAEPKR